MVEADCVLVDRRKRLGGVAITVPLEVVTKAPAIYRRGKHVASCWNKLGSRRSLDLTHFLWRISVSLQTTLTDTTRRTRKGEDCLLLGSVPTNTTTKDTRTASVLLVVPMAVPLDLRQTIFDRAQKVPNRQTISARVQKVPNQETERVPLCELTILRMRLGLIMR